MSTTPQRRVLVAAIGSPCAYCAEAMAVPDRPPRRDHIKPRSKGARRQPRRGLLPLQHRQGLSIAGAMAYAPVTGWRLSCRSCRVVHAGEGHAARLRKAFSGVAHYLARWRLEAIYLLLRCLPGASKLKPRSKARAFFCL
jgi:hypothetical protein